MNESNNKLFQQIEQAFYNDGYLLVNEIIDDTITVSLLYKMIEKAYHQIDNFMLMFEQKCNNENKSVDCKKGCSWCCNQSVIVFPFEVFYIEKYLHSILNDEIKNSIKQKTIEKNNKVSKMKASEYVHLKMPCPLLFDDSCIIYNARPMACRIFISSDVNSCKKEYHDPKNFKIFPSLYDLPLRVGRMMNEGIRSALREKGLDLEEIRLESALSNILIKKITDIEWINKEKNFKECMLTDEDKEYFKKL